VGEREATAATMSIAGKGAPRPEPDDEPSAPAAHGVAPSSRETTPRISPTSHVNNTVPRRSTADSRCRCDAVGRCSLTLSNQR
jgi:hypothetical protein